MRTIIAVFAALAVVFTSACVSSPQESASYRVGEGDVLVLVLLDGFRADYLDRGHSPTLRAMADAGVSASMRPSFPSVSAPNHTTLVTGRRPDNHGVIDNLMMDQAIPGWFGAGNAAVDHDPRWWAEATPLYITATRQGVRSGEMFWYGADIPYDGDLPADRRPEGALSLNAKVDAVLAWFDRPAAERPRFVVLPVFEVDEAGHVFGPNAPETNAAIAAADAAVTRLIEGLRARNALDGANFVIAADHGMTEVSTEQRVILLDDFVDASRLVVTTYGAYIGVNPRPGFEAEVERAMLQEREHLECWRKNEIPARFHYGAHWRVPAIFCLADRGWLVMTRAIGEAARAHYPSFNGNHGYDPADPEMAALFIANGPAFRRGVTLPAFDNVDAYPMMAEMLGVEPGEHDGDADTLRAALRE
ncbi:MAG: ectonucleotide pyrophosphatase/phosphodiesterase [Hyphomonadaceae bacterium JAD_PAG50586_4]|nr:MAG: ectonucleotide pyrophosphatase/phosphodiesterase [Hyphomonadaceae bacterium JAD_PAG50586_4]